MEKVERHFCTYALPTKAKCCQPDQGEASWNFLKRRLAELGLVSPGDAGESGEDQPGTAVGGSYGRRITNRGTKSVNVHQVFVEGASSSLT